MDGVISSGDTRFHSVVSVGLVTRLPAKKLGFGSPKSYEIFPSANYRLTLKPNYPRKEW